MKRRVAATLARAARVLAGAMIHREPPQDVRQRVYFANHTSHLDFVVIWAALPSRIRALTRPVAAKDYWDRKGLRGYLAREVFNAVLIERAPAASSVNPIEMLADGLGQQHSLILFPEGTRSNQADPSEFKSGIYRLALQRPDVELVPVLIDNLNRILPKGEFMPVPLLSHVAFGRPIRVEEGEDKAAFLKRARASVLELRQW